MSKELGDTTQSLNGKPPIGAEILDEGHSDFVVALSFHDRSLCGHTSKLVK
jgi:hypothetical protein